MHLALCRKWEYLELGNGLLSLVNNNFLNFIFLCYKQSWRTTYTWVYHLKTSRVGGISFWFHFCSSYNNDIFHIHLSHSPLSRVQTPLSPEGPVVWRPISANPGLNFYPCFFSFRSKAFFRTIFSILFRASNHLPWVSETISTVFGFCQVFIVTRCSWLRPSVNTWGKPLIPRVQIIKLWTKRIKLNLLFKLSYLNWNFALTLGYLNPALNNPAQNFFQAYNSYAIS